MILKKNSINRQGDKETGRQGNRETKDRGARTQETRERETRKQGEGDRGTRDSKQHTRRQGDKWTGAKAIKLQIPISIFNSHFHVHCLPFSNLVLHFFD